MCTAPMKMRKGSTRYRLPQREAMAKWRDGTTLDGPLLRVVLVAHVNKHVVTKKIAHSITHAMLASPTTSTKMGHLLRMLMSLF